MTRMAMIQRIAMLLAVPGFALLAQQLSAQNSTARTGVFRSVTVGKPDNTGVYHRPTDRLGTPLTEGQCTGLGGVVVAANVKSCSKGKACFTSDPDGVIHRACITE